MMKPIAVILLISSLLSCEHEKQFSEVDKKSSQDNYDSNKSVKKIINNSEVTTNESKTLSAEISSEFQNKSFGSTGSDSVDKLQKILVKANPSYRGQGKIHQENGRIFAAEFPNCSLRDLSPLRGLKLEALDLSGNPVREIRHLRGMPLTRLFLENTNIVSLENLKEAKLIELRLNGSPIQSLSGLEGQPLENLYAVGTQINNISALSSTNLRQLWLTESPVSDLSPLAGLPLVSLTVHRTLVDDLSFIRKLPVIQRLHIGETLVTDLSPLRGLNLTRLVFTPGNIKSGMKVARNLSNLREIGTKFDDQGRNLMVPDIFWAKF